MATDPLNDLLNRAIDDLIKELPMLGFTYSEHHGNARKYLRERLRALVDAAIEADRERIAQAIDGLVDRGETSAVRSVDSALRLASAAIRAGGR